MVGKGLTALVLCIFFLIWCNERTKTVDQVLLGRCGSSWNTGTIYSPLALTLPPEVHDNILLYGSQAS